MITSKFAPKKPKELDLRYANPEAQAYVREQAIRLHQEGWTNVDIAKHFNVHKNTVGKWLKRARSEGVENAVKGQKRGRRENTQSFLSDEQKQQLLDFITDHCPTDFGKLFKNPCSQAELNKIVPFGFSLQRQKNGVFFAIKIV